MRATALVGAGTAGCLGEGLGGGNGSADGGDGGGNASRGSDGSTEVRGTSFAVLDTGCGTATSEAAVSHGDGAVVIRGTITGSGTAATAALHGASYDEEADRLRVAVGTTAASGDDDRCSNEIAYRASVGFTDGLPSSTVVYHDGVRVDGTDDPGRRLEDVSFEVRRIDAGEARAAATPSVAGDRLRVDGTITGADGCETALLDGVTVDDGVTVEVVTMADAPGPCTDAVAEIDYRATVRFVGDVPRRITVRHDGDPVAALTLEEDAAAPGETDGRDGAPTGQG